MRRFPSKFVALPAFFILTFAAAQPSFATYTFTNIVNVVNADPTTVTVVRGISGNTIAGYYVGTSTLSPAHGTFHGFTETNGIITLIDDPLADMRTNAFGTIVTAIDGNVVVGYFRDQNFEIHGFSESNGTFTTLDAVTTPFHADTEAFGISGNTIVGNYAKSTGGNSAFVETNGIFTTVNFPPITGAAITGISGNTIVGNYTTPGLFSHGFVSTLGNLTTLDFPGATTTDVTGISGNTVVGTYRLDNMTDHGFIETNGIFTTVDNTLPNIIGTIITGIDGTTLVGWSGQSISGINSTQSFIASLDSPEPASLSLLTLASLPLLHRRRKHSN